MPSKRRISNRETRNTLRNIEDRVKSKFPQVPTPDGRVCRVYDSCVVPGGCHKGLGKIRYVKGRKNWSYCRYWIPPPNEEEESNSQDQKYRK